ncbi:MAG: efflux transporter outer membrane subunit [Desulfobacterales bacterium]|jgi:multidrug efflux system outer membrane protein|nr:efflux transporter outer membrane subunit [Desulfobacterales bacterium]
MNKNLFLLLGGILFLGGCMLTPEYTKPEAPIPADWPSGPAYKTARTTPGAPSPTDLPWQEFFTDKRLQQVIETALANNRDLRLAALNVQRARAVYRIQRSALYPALDATANGSKQRIPADLTTEGHARTAEQYDVSMGILAWEIDFFGRIRSLKDQALETFLATEQARRGTQILIISTVADTYLTLAADRENLKLAKTTFDTQTSAYHLIKRRHEVGLGSELDLHRAQTQVDIARGDIARYMQLVAQDENTLNLLVGTLSPIPSETLSEDLANIKPLKPISAGISSEVLLHRPDILQAELLLKAANANIGVARAALFPRISLTTAVGTASNELSGLFGSGSGTWLFAPQINLPIFDARLWSALDAVKAEQEIVLVQYEKAIQTAFREVADTLAVQGTMDERLLAQQSLVRAAEATYRLSNARYTKGVDNYLSVLDAQRALYAAQQGLVGLRQTKLSNQVRLYAVLGGGA